MSKAKKPAFLFIFSDNQSSEEFLAVANKHSDVSYAQHPLDDNGRGARILNRVLVTGTGSHLFDLSLREELEKIAVTLGGYYSPKVNDIP